MFLESYKYEILACCTAFLFFVILFYNHYIFPKIEKKIDAKDFEIDEYKVNSFLIKEEYEEKNLESLNTIEKAREAYKELKIEYKRTILDNHKLKEENIKLSEDLKSLNHEKNLLLNKIKKYENRSKYYENIKKGKDFEKKVEEYFKDQNYLVENRASKYGKKDNGIDLIAKKDGIYYLIQCKNYDTVNGIRQKTISKFNGDCWDIINNSNKLTNKNTKFLFIISNKESLHYGALKYFEENRNKCEYLVYKLQKDKYE